MKKLLLIYIPCHKDFNAAISQAKKLRKYYEQNIPKVFQNLWEIQLILSINDYKLNSKQKKNAFFYFDQVVDYGNVFLFDANIVQGFFKALEVKPELFWILSTNDLINSKSLETIFDEFNSVSGPDLLVAGDVKYTHQMQIINSDWLFNPNYQFGLISGVVYNFHKFSVFFNAAPFFTWTGWGHLSVILNGIQSKQQIFANIVPKNRLFDQMPQISGQNSKYYSHSYFGSLILIQLINKSPYLRKRNIRKFVYKNFYLHNFFSIQEKPTNFNSNIISSNNYLDFNKRLTGYIILSQTPFTFFVFKILTKINFAKFEKYFRYIRRRVKST